MARAGVASASARPDSIKGLAQSIAKPAYRRLLTAEPLLRRAVPVLIIAFLATICVGAVVQVLDHRRQSLNDMVVALDAVADIAAERLQQPLAQPADARARPQEVLAQRAAALGHRRRPALHADQCGGRGSGRYARRRRHHRPPPDRPARSDATAHHLRRRRRRHGNHLARRQPRAGDRAHAESPVRPDRRRAVARGGARGLALAHHADHHAVGHHRLRRADPRLRLPLAGDAGARSGPDLRNGPQPHRYRAQPRPLRLVGLGPRARPHLLVAVDVRHSRACSQGRPADVRRRQRAGASGRRAALRPRGANSPKPRRPPSITPSACATPTAIGSGCARAASWCASRASRARI